MLPARYGTHFLRYFVKILQQKDYLNNILEIKNKQLDLMLASDKLCQMPKRYQG